MKLFVDRAYEVWKYFVDLLHSFDNDDPLLKDSSEKEREKWREAGERSRQKYLSTLPSERSLLRARLEAKRGIGKPFSERVFVNTRDGRQYQVTTCFTQESIIGGNRLHNIKYLNNQGAKRGEDVYALADHLSDLELQ